jgi:hypothetical protein
MRLKRGSGVELKMLNAASFINRDASEQFVSKD